MADLEKLKEFAVSDAAVTLWVFRKKSVKDAAPIFTSRWAELGDDLTSAMKQVALYEISRIEEVIDNSLLAQNNEGSSLSISLIETHADAVKASASAETTDRRVRRAEGLNNSFFYLAKFTVGDGVLLGVKKTDASWKTKRQSGLIPLLFKDNTLVIDEQPNFNLSKYFDFMVLGDDVFVKEKGNFESVLEYKIAHQDDFVSLCAEEEFGAAFVDLDELKKFVGSNKIQLRRMASIHQKKHYKNVVFMQNLRKDHAKAGLNIKFDETGKIVPSQATCRDIFQALLDHRLLSMFSSNLYHVPDTTIPSSPN